MLMSLRKVNGKWLSVKEEVKPLQGKIIFGKPFLFLANKIPHKKLSSCCKSLPLKSLYWNKNIIISFSFCLLSATISIEAPWILLFQVTLFLKSLSIICFQLSSSSFRFLVVIVGIDLVFLLICCILLILLFYFLLYFVFCLFQEKTLQFHVLFCLGSQDLVCFPSENECK